MKVATFNINGINQRFDSLLQWLSTSQPDIACLQELKAEDTRFPQKALEEAGYGAIWHGQKSWNGVAILARGADPIETRRGLPGGGEDAQSRYLEAAVNGILVGCLYLPNGNPQPGPKFAYKLAWFERLIAHAGELRKSGHPVALCGDFNVVPTDVDIYDPRSWKKNALLQPESRAAFARLLGQGWTDSLRALHPDERIYTFWDYFRDHWARDAGLRIDHLLLSPDLAKRLSAAGVDRFVRDLPHASDHAPVWIEVADGAARRRAAPGKKAATRAARQAPPRRAGARSGPSRQGTGALEQGARRHTGAHALAWAQLRSGPGAARLHRSHGSEAAEERPGVGQFRQGGCVLARRDQDTHASLMRRQLPGGPIRSVVQKN